MSDWDAKQFAKEITAGNFDGHLHEELEKISADQLNELIEAMNAAQEKKTKDAAWEVNNG